MKRESLYISIILALFTLNAIQAVSHLGVRHNAAVRVVNVPWATHELELTAKTFRGKRLVEKLYLFEPNLGADYFEENGGELSLERDYGVQLNQILIADIHVDSGADNPEEEISRQLIYKGKRYRYFPRYGVAYTRAD